MRTAFVSPRSIHPSTSGFEPFCVSDVNPPEKCPAGLLSASPLWACPVKAKPGKEFEAEALAGPSSPILWTVGMPEEEAVSRFPVYGRGSVGPLLVHRGRCSGRKGQTGTAATEADGRTIDGG